MVIDATFIVLLIMAVIKGYSKGFIVAIFSFAAIIIGLAAAIKLSALVAGWLQSSTHINMAWLPAVSFAIVMFVTALLVRLGANIVQRSVEFVFMGWINKIGGIFLYAALYITVLSVVIFFAEKMDLLKPTTIQASKFYAFIQPFGPKAINGFGQVIPLFRNMFTQLENFFASENAQMQ
ncbi:MAG: CvpA family protein [Chitinophagaceae bacterium]|nr:CvpA family protein [Chitinophagaceae bacterium]